MPFSDKQIEAIILSTRITSVFNFLGSLFTIITFLLFKEARNGATSLIFSLSISDLLSGFSISFFWSIIFNSESTIPCNLQASLLMFGLCASMLWGLMIGCYLFLVLYKNVDIEVVDRFLFVFHIISWGYALVSAILPIGFKQYGEMFPNNKNSWCWVDDPKSAFRLLMYIPDSIIFTILILLYGLVRFRLKSAKNSNSIANEICNKMSIYILTYAFINFFAIINRIQDFFSPDSAIFELYLLQFITQPLQGFLNAIAYVWNEPVFIESYKQLFAKLKSKHKPSKQIQSEKDRLMSLVCYENDP